MDRFSYQVYEMLHLAFAPARALSEMTTHYIKNAHMPVSQSPFARNILAYAELFERMTRRYGKPVFGLDTTVVEGETIPIVIEPAWSRPFCQLLRFTRVFPGAAPRQSKLLIVAPMSGDYATLLRGTVEAFLPTHDVYVTDWSDARSVPYADGRFDLEDYIDYLAEIMTHLATTGEKTPVHTLGVCQASVPLISAIATMEAKGDPNAPESMVLMGGPIDPRVNPTAVNRLAVKRGIGWFKQHCIHTVPFPNAGMGRRVYPGFLQLSGFMAMNIERHVSAHVEMFNHLVEGDGDSAERHRDFYDEYLAVMDLTAEFYLQTVEEIFVKHALAKGNSVIAASASIFPRFATRRCSPSKARRTTSLASARPMPRTGFVRTSPRRAACTMCRRASAITASSTARASAKRSRRASRTSSRQWKSASKRWPRAKSEKVDRLFRSEFAPAF